MLLLESIINNRHIDFNDPEDLPTEPGVDLLRIYKLNNINMWPILGTLKGMDGLLACFC